MPQHRSGSKRSESSYDPDAEVIIEDPDLNGGRPKSRNSRKNSSIVMLDLSQSRLALYFLAAQASILVILLALILYFSSVLSNIRSLAQSVSDNLQMGKNVLDSAQQTLQQATQQSYGVRYRIAPRREEPAVTQPTTNTGTEETEEETPRRRRPKPS